MGDSTDIIRQAVTQDLFGPGALAEPMEIEPPDKYELADCLGRGGFGVVYKARDKVLDRFVALKFLTDARPADLERFRREARFAARLNDPAIVQVYEFGEHQGQPFIAMQFVDGGNLTQAKLDMSGIVHAIRDVAKALSHAHAEGIVHRDFKPANVLLDEKGRAYLTDFGIARDLRAVHGATISHAGALMGTPALMPPEQARGELHAVDARSDIYALGASLYVLLTGRYPFRAENVVEVLHAVLHDQPPLPRSINPAIPRALETVIVKCMKKRPDRRYQAMSEVVADLDAHLSGRPMADEPSAWFRKLVGAAPEVETPQMDTHQLLGMEVARDIASWDANLYRVSTNVTRLYPKLDAIIDRLTGVLSGNPNHAWARFWRGVAMARRGRFDEALDDMERSIDRLADHAAAQFEMGNLYLTLFVREQQAAFKHFSRFGTRVHLKDSRNRLHQAVIAFKETQRLKADLLQWQFDYATAVTRLADEDFDGCIADCDRILKTDPDLEDVWKLRGDALRFSGGDPFESYDRAIAVRRSFCDAYLGKAGALLDRDQIVASRRCLTEALEVHPDCVAALAQLAGTYLTEARRTRAGDGAMTGEQKAEALSLIDTGQVHAERAVALDDQCYDVVVTLAELAMERGRINAQRGAFDRSLAELEKARRLPGCQNRASYLTAQAHLERARLSDPADRQRRRDLDEVVRYASEAGLYVPGNEPWQALLREAQELLGINDSAR